MIDDFLNNLNEKLDILSKKIEKLQPQTSEINVLSSTDVAKILGVNKNTANNLFKQKNFPKIQGIKSNKIEKTAFYNWLQSQENRK